ncbi:beta-carotene 15,15'-monooxygenase [Bacillus sp. UNC438CL73TsuS30]|uniref:beta-carotene 15,15'-monooxygenase n=1 Tax=Bacillus sp. UNC438CL73TsuS30 TaxID=1340434 RepID=UPI001E620E1B|nr:beta-carotene 15,15'-monooxygenase [Bacillus sp. UNC438CL73TsuS30]
MLKRTFNRNFLLILLLFVLAANYSLYHTAIGNLALPKNTNIIVVASMIDLAFIAPVLLLVWKRKFNWRNMVLGVAGGLVIVRILIPIKYLAPFEAVTWVGFAVEGGLLLLEILVLGSLFIYLPKIARSVKESTLPVIFSFSNAVEQQFKSYPIIRVICSEMLMFYYAFASWRKKTTVGPNVFTLHQKSSLIAFQIMLIHATVIEMAGLHWMFHDRSMVLSIIMLVLNVYTLIFFLGDIQVVRHNPLLVTKESIYISLGLMKKIEIKWSDIEEVFDDPEQLNKKRNKDTIEFIARDFEPVQPDVILKLKQPVEATLIMGIKKEYSKVAIRVDDPKRFKEVLKDNLKSSC